jgi:arylsulfatase A-like enzyme
MKFLAFKALFIFFSFSQIVNLLHAKLPDLSGMNILFLCPEDWSAEAMGVYGNEEVKTPNIDSFAKESMVFTKAYCQNPVCNPSRSSFNTGLRSATTGVWGNPYKLQEVLPEWATSIGETLAEHPIQTYMIGKLFHHNWDAVKQSSAYNGILSNPPDGYKGRKIKYNIPKGTPPNPEKNWTYTSDPEWDAQMIEAMKKREELWANSKKGSKQWDEGRKVFQTFQAELIGESGDIEERNPDGIKARVIADLIREYANKEEKFFITFGSSRPHTPLIAPKKYFDLYDPSKLSTTQATKDLDNNVPDVARRFGNNWDIFKIRDQNDVEAKKAIHAYYACATFIDDQIGLMLEALEETGQADNTIVIVTSDHGFHLGEHGMWSKISLFEQATRVPFMIKIPGYTDGVTCNEIIELVDIYPSICEMLKIDLPHEKLEGISFLPLLEDPNKSWKKGAFTVCKQGKYLGKSLRTKSHRYTEWIDYMDKDDPNAEVSFREMYNLDKDKLEQNNLADNIEYAPKQKELTQLLKIGWKGALPDSI